MTKPEATAILAFLKAAQQEIDAAARIAIGAEERIRKHLSDAVNLHLDKIREMAIAELS